MLGIDYPSSDEEEEIPATKPEVRLESVGSRAPIATNIELTIVTPAIAPSTDPPAELPTEAPSIAQSLVSSEPVSGPSQGPAVSSPQADNDAPNNAPPGSPYTSNRALVQNLTLPAVPNFNIPPSPPGSPSQKATKKFAQFLDLKIKGTHFNQRLETSSVLRDPGHMQRLMKFTGLEDEDLYASTLSEDVAVPVVFPAWAYVEELRDAQKKLAKAKELERSKTPREAIDFVSANRSGTSSGTGIPSGKTSRQSTAGRAMGGSDREQLKSQSVSKRKELEHRSRESASSGAQRRSRSRSPKRRR